MKKIKIGKAFFLNENLKHPICQRCGKETSPYSIISEELNKFSLKVLENFVAEQRIILNRIAPNVHIIFICKHCLKDYIFNEKKS